MKKMILTFATLLLYVVGYAQSNTDEKAVRAVLQKMEDAWNAHDYTYTGQYDIYAPNASIINPVGMYWKSRAEIVKAHQVFGEMMLQYESTKTLQEDVRFLAPTVALATIKNQYRVEQDYMLPGGQQKISKGGTNQAMLNVILSKKDDQWKIASLQVTGIDVNAAAYDPVKRQAGQ